jgi:radical SAM superfamily enzyme YgiQ (UPF0313 family)
MRVALIEAGSPGLNIYSHVAMGRGIALLGTCVRDAGHDVRVYIEDVSGRDSTDWDFVKDADVVGFSSITCTLPRTGELLRRTREVNPHSVTVLGGPEPTCAPQRSLDLGVDFVLRGEAELTLPRLLAAIGGAEEEPLSEIEGLLWREEGALRSGPEPRQLTRAELDALPIVDHSLVHQADMTGVATVWRARGCPARCDFCEVCEIWPRYTRRSDERSLEEIASAQRAGYGTAFLIDDNAAADKKSFKEFLSKMVETGFSRTLVTQLRADSVFTHDGRIDHEFLKLLKRAAALTVVCVGVESADDCDLERIHKREPASQTARALRAMRRQGLLVHGMFIAFAEDTADVVRRNTEYAKSCVSSLQYLFETPLPGTKRTAEHEASGSLLFPSGDDLAFYDGMHVVLKPQRMTVAEMQAAVVRGYKSFYSIQRVVASAVRGLFRFRLLSEAQRAQIARLPMWRRFKEWLLFQAQYKWGPMAFLATGRYRIKEFMRDPDYARYLAKVDAL